MLQFKVFIYHVFAQDVTGYFVGVYIIIKITYFFMGLVYYFFQGCYRDGSPQRL